MVFEGGTLNVFGGSVMHAVVKRGGVLKVFHGAVHNATLERGAIYMPMCDEARAR